MKSWLPILGITLGISSCGKQNTTIGKGEGKAPPGESSASDDSMPPSDKSMDSQVKDPSKDPSKEQSSASTNQNPPQTKTEEPKDSPQKSDPNSSEATQIKIEGLANQRLLDFYTKKPNYDRVYKEVLSFYPDGRSNGCVAFLSSALRLTQTFVPRDKVINGYNVSLVTIAFSDYLSKTLKWRVIKDVNLLLPGDVVMTVPPPEYPGIPAHTYMFQNWKDRKNGIGIVVDNQAFSHERNIFGSGTYNFTPFWYALRSPPQSPAPLALAH
ncbi:MAG: hypothetical protein WCI18_11055 [Pseudomonadota bacterium]